MACNFSTQKQAGGTSQTKALSLRAAIERSLYECYRVDFEQHAQIQVVHRGEFRFCQLG